MTAIERGEALDAKALAGGDDRGVDEAEGQVAVLLEQLGDAGPVGWLDRLD